MPLIYGCNLRKCQTINISLCTYIRNAGDKWLLSIRLIVKQFHRNKRHFPLRSAPFFMQKFSIKHTKLHQKQITHYTTHTRYDSPTHVRESKRLLSLLYFIFKLCKWLRCSSKSSKCVREN